jgi:hypothetical protein
MKDALVSWRVRRDLYQGSDYLLIISVFTVVLHFCGFELRSLWKKENKRDLRERAKEISSFPCTFSSISDIDFSIDLLISWMKEVIAEHVPTSKPVPFCMPWWSDKIGK